MYQTRIKEIIYKDEQTIRIDEYEINRNGTTFLRPLVHCGSVTNELSERKAKVITIFIHGIIRELPNQKAARAFL